nr:anaerobic glycerol-3-phosphate dehydrogenase subunit C [Chloroflexota bacterium]
MTLLTTLTSDLCIKCNICTSACPVAAVTDLFPGPKAVGPQAQRFRHPDLPSADHSVDYCSGCGVCSLVCPHGVQIAEMNAIARSRLVERDGLPLRNRLLGRSELLGKLGSPFAPLSNIPLKLPPLRKLIEALLGIDARARFPAFSRQTFRRWFQRHTAGAPLIGFRKVVFFHGCATNYYEPRVGQAAIAVLERNQIKVSIAEQNCCGLPMQSNGDFASARAYARSNIRKLAPWVREGYVIVGTSTSCTLALKHEYHSVLGLTGEEVDLLADNTYDIFEFLEMLDEAGQLDTRFVRRSETVVYHAPCQQRSHAIGRPAADFMRRVGFTVVESQTDCCGVAGTYGLKKEKYDIAAAVGHPLFEQIAEVNPSRVVCDSETCRWWIESHTGKKSVHPIEVLAEAYKGRKQ